MSLVLKIQVGDEIFNSTGPDRRTRCPDPDRSGGNSTLCIDVSKRDLRLYRFVGSLAFTPEPTVTPLGRRLSNPDHLFTCALREPLP